MEDASIITPKLVAKAADILLIVPSAQVEKALRAALPDIIMAAVKVAKAERDEHDPTTLMWETAERIRAAIRRLAQEAGQ